jgi:hypothetical protein
MSRDRLRDAVRELADRLYDALRGELRDELLAELRRELKGAAPAEVPPPTGPRAPSPPAAGSLAERVLAWVTAHPRATPGAILEAIGGNRKSLHLVLASARESGALVREGTRPRVWYSTPDAPRGPEPSPKADSAMPGPKPDAFTRVVAFVRARPDGCSLSELDGLGLSRSSLFDALARAVAQGLIHRTKSGRTAAYRPAGAPQPPAVPNAPQPAKAKALAENPTATSGVLERVVAFVGARPNGCTPKDMDLGVSRTSLFNALSRAVADGLIQRTGNGRGVAYRPLGAPPPSPLPVTREARAKAPAAPTVATNDLAGAVAAYVREHPECRYADLQGATGASEGRLRAAINEARAAGTIRMAGVKIKARYFPVEAAPPQAEAPPPVVRRATVPPPAPPPPPPAPPPPSPGVVAADLAAADAVLRELDEALEDGSHDIRLGALLQAIVAEVRLLQQRVPERHALAHRLDGTIRRITAIRAERNLPFITGLKRGATADWSRLSRDARQRVARFDLDAEAVAPARKSQRPPPAPKASPKAHVVEVERLPRLAAIAEERAIVLVGGIKKNEVLEQARRHYALDLEWAAMQGANARAADAVVDRIRHGNIGAVVVLEALTGTTQVKSVVAACKEAGVPFAYGGAAGTESLRSALREIDASAARLQHFNHTCARSRGGRLEGQIREREANDR